MLINKYGKPKMDHYSDSDTAILFGSVRWELDRTIIWITGRLLMESFKPEIIIGYRPTAEMEREIYNKAEKEIF